ncbi:hypothetical protein DVB69_06490 [Sporosarcina sp. BI001-red]|nr:hypothetical protein DVB69_06490 [Sporosarcina sp. BI001-red]
MKASLSFTGDHSKAQVFLGIQKVLLSKMLKFDIHKGEEELFENLAYKAMHITVMERKEKKISDLKITMSISQIARVSLKISSFPLAHIEGSSVINPFRNKSHTS